MKADDIIEELPYLPVFIIFNICRWTIMTMMMGFGMILYKKNISSIIKLQF